MGACFAEINEGEVKTIMDCTQRYLARAVAYAGML